MLEVCCWLPRGCVVALPLNQVLEAVVVQAADKNGLDFPFLHAIDDDVWWWRCSLSWVRVVGGVLQE